MPSAGGDLAPSFNKLDLPEREQSRR